MSNQLCKEIEILLIENDDCIEDVEIFEIIEEGDWVSEGKYEICETIVKYKDKLFAVKQSRTGSYYSDYYYNEPNAYEVEPKEITKTIYVRVQRES